MPYKLIRIIIYRAKGHYTDIAINIEIVSIKPKMFVIDNIISDTEAKLVKQVATPKLHRSGTGQSEDANHNDETRTSQTAWIAYTEHVIIDTIFKRTADILQIDEQVLKRNAEQMQSVFYATGEEYKAHHDFSDNGRDTASRYITILFYLNEQADIFDKQYKSIEMNTNNFCMIELETNINKNKCISYKYDIYNKFKHSKLFIIQSSHIILNLLQTQNINIKDCKYDYMIDMFDTIYNQFQQLCQSDFVLVCVHYFLFFVVFNLLIVYIIT